MKKTSTRARRVGRGTARTSKTRKSRSVKSEKIVKSRPYRMRVAKNTPRLQAMFKHIFNSCLDEGKTKKEAERIAAAKVNQFRRRHGLLVEDVGRDLWYPGKVIKNRAEREAQFRAEQEAELKRSLVKEIELLLQSPKQHKGRRN